LQNVIFCAEEPAKATRAPLHFNVALTADPAYRDWNPPSVVAALKGQGRRVYAWCDCRPWGAGTPASEAYAMMERYGLNGVILQAETPQEFDHAMTAWGLA
jgi:hypothetical protein